MGKNKKGDNGFIIGYWNTFGPDSSWHNENDKTIKTYIKNVEVISCGQKQMTLLEKQSGEMTKAFHKPNRTIYTSIDDAKTACENLMIEWIEKSIPKAKKYLATLEIDSSGYKWMPERKKQVIQFINDLETNKVIKEIIIL